MLTDSEQAIGVRRLAIFGGLLAVFAVVVVVAAFMRGDRDSVLVIGARRDCMRAFDADTCEALNVAAFKIHLKVAPQFPNRHLCEMTFGPSGCLVSGDVPAFRIYVPKMTVVLAADGADPKGLLPLYFGPGGDDENGGRAVYYRGSVVGRFSEIRFGGAKLSRVVDLDGAPFTGSAVEKFRGR